MGGHSVVVRVIGESFFGLLGDVGQLGRSDVRVELRVPAEVHHHGRTWKRKTECYVRSGGVRLG